MQAKIVYAGSKNTSYTEAADNLRELMDLAISDKEVRRVCKPIGAERCVERDAATAAYQALPLVERKGVPAGVTAPDLAVVGVDGGRLQVIDAADDDANDDANEDSHDDGRDESPNNGRHWREDKIGLLMTMTSDEHEADPCPEIPESFVNPLRILKLTRELKKGSAKEPAEQSAEPATAAEEPLAEWKPPKVKAKALVATRRPWLAFALMVAAAAWQKGFYGAARKAFLGDGAAANWTLWRNHFSSFVPILDFIHALSYVFAAALAGREFADGWACYVRWIAAVWQGRVDEVIAALAERQSELGMWEKSDPATAPRRIVGRALEYLRNNRERMKYAEYRRAGLPVVSSYVESAVKQFNYRVKGSEKFWTEDGAEEMLQLRGDQLSDDRPLDAFWERRSAKATGQRPYRKAA
ncbi:MAG TPA: hypothetical protein VGI99_02980 [Gemmataceae bacterium]